MQPWNWEPTDKRDPSTMGDSMTMPKLSSSSACTRLTRFFICGHFGELFQIATARKVRPWRSKRENPDPVQACFRKPPKPSSSAAVSGSGAVRLEIPLFRIHATPVESRADVHLFVVNYEVYRQQSQGPKIQQGYDSLVPYCVRSYRNSRIFDTIRKGAKSDRVISVRPMR